MNDWHSSIEQLRDPALASPWPIAEEGFDVASPKAVSSIGHRKIERDDEARVKQGFA